jgi:diguanylate cyclase (GGDEF)-like protein
MARLAKWLVSLTLPDSLLVLAAVGFLRPGGLPAVLAPLEQAFAYLVLAGGILLGLYLRHSRILLAMVLLALADRALGSLAGVEASSVGIDRVVFTSVALLLPLNLLALALITEREIRISREVLRLTLILAQAFLVGWICLPENAAVAAALESPFIDPRHTRWTPLAQAPLLAFGAALLLQVVRFTLVRNPLDRGFFWALVSAFIALHGMRAGWSPTSYLATAGLILVIAAYAEVYRSTYYDELTGLRGRVALDQALYNLGHRYAIALIDVDHLKQVNAAHGFPAGDQVLRMVASKIAALSANGSAFRDEGNRFVVVFPGKPANEVAVSLEELRIAVSSSPVTLSARKRLFRRPTAPERVSVTISVGMAERDERRTTSAQVVKAAEVAMARAKSAGGNQVKARLELKDPS